MNKHCSRINHLMDRMLKKELSENDYKEIKLHIINCPKCRECFKSQKIALSVNEHQFKEIKVPSSFNSELHNKLAQINQKERDKKTFTSYLNYKTAILSLLIVLASIFTINSISVEKKVVVLSKTEVPDREPITIELEYIAKREIKDVSIEIKLDNGVSFFSRYDSVTKLKKYSWNKKFKKGSNKIPFVVEVNKKGEWNIEAYAKFNGYTHKHKILLKNSNGKVTVTMLKYPKIKIE